MKTLRICMLLKNLIKDIPSDKRNIFISGIASNSKEVKKNYIFFAIKGNKINGEKFIKDAIKKGASVIICSKKCKFKDKNIVIIGNGPTGCDLATLALNYKPKSVTILFRTKRWLL